MLATQYMVVALILVFTSSRDLVAQSGESQMQTPNDPSLSQGVTSSSGWFIEGGLQLPFLSNNSVSQYSANSAEYSIESDVSNAQPTLWIGGGYRVGGGLDAGLMVIYRTGEVKTTDSLTDAGVTGWTADLFLTCDILHTLASGISTEFPLELSLGIGASLGDVNASFPVFSSYRRNPPFFQREGAIVPTQQNLFGVSYIARSGYRISESILAILMVRWAFYPQIDVDYEEVQQRQPNSTEGFGFSMNSRDAVVGIRYRL